MTRPPPIRLACLLLGLGMSCACASTPPAPAGFVWHPHIAKPGIPFLYSEDFQDVLDQALSPNGEGVELTSKTGEKRRFNRLRDWCQATDDGWYPYTTYDMAGDSCFSHAYQAAAYFSLAKPSVTSFVQSGFAGITTNDVPADLWQDCGDPTLGIDNPRLAPVFPKATILQDAERPNTLTVNFGEDNDDPHRPDCQLTILAWGDFNGDGIEDILVHERFCPGGSLVCRGTSLFTRKSADAPLERVHVALPHWKTLDRRQD